MKCIYVCDIGTYHNGCKTGGTKHSTIRWIAQSNEKRFVLFKYIVVNDFDANEMFTCDAIKEKTKLVSIEDWFWHHFGHLFRIQTLILKPNDKSEKSEWYDMINDW